MYKKGEISRSEALSEPNYRGALRYLQDTGIVKMTVIKEERERKKEEKMLSLMEDRNQMDELRRRLFKFVATR